jgi:hypothetical protein
MFNKKNFAIGYAIAIALAAIFVTVLVSGALVSTKTISSTGIVASANLGIYSDSACTQALTSIDWGTISPGGSVSKTIYVKNVGNTQVTLSMSKTNWNPSTANGPITITWNRENTVLTVNQVSTATLTLSVLSTASGISTFSVDIVISGTG